MYSLNTDEQKLNDQNNIPITEEQKLNDQNNIPITEEEKLNQLKYA